MDGKVAMDIFKEAKTVNFIKSWEHVKGDFGELQTNNASNLLSDEETMQQLIELGYVEKADVKTENAVKKTRCDLKHNLARVYLGKKKYKESRAILLELILEENIDLSPYYMDLITIGIEMGNFDEAEVYIEKLKSEETEVKYSIFLSEASILMGKGKFVKALEILEAAKSEGRENNPEIWFKIGAINHSLGKFEKAQEAYEKAIELEPDKAKYHTALAENLIELNQYEEAVDFALTSIELVKYQPKAHYVLGRALEKFGDLENAQKAYEMASRLMPKSHLKAEHAIENIEERIAQIDKSDYKYRKDQIVIVSGLPRSGTSLMMQMINKGGIEALTDDKRQADISNPKGYYEYEPVMALHKDNSWLHKAQNKSLKVVAPLLKFLGPKYRYKVIFMNRDLGEVVKSQQKMIGKNTESLPVKLFQSYTKHLNQVEVWKEKTPNVELIYLDYKEVLTQTDQAIDKVAKFIGVEMNKEAMKRCIDTSLYRNKA